jgi:hypothetical protein
MQQFYAKWEQLLKNRVNTHYLKHLERLYGIKVRLLRSTKNVYSKVYGMESGDTETGKFEEIIAIVTAENFSPLDRFNAGLLNDGYLYTSQEGKVLVGDTVEVRRDDRRAYRFKVVSRESIGVSESIISRFKISAVGEGNGK